MCGKEVAGGASFCKYCGSKLATSEGNDEWYYSYHGERKGPITTKQVLDYYEEGFFRDESAVWKQGFSDWVRLDQCGIELPKIEWLNLPPVSVKNINNSAFIMLLIVPIIACLVKFYTAGILNIDSAKLWWIAYGFNSVFCIIDYARVKKAGYDTDGLSLTYVFLVPIYIYKRMRLVNGLKWISTIIWIASFAITLIVNDAFWVKIVGVSNPGIIRSVQEGHFRNYPNTTKKCSRMP